MPSPFPGMDPFLEDPGIFPDLHHNLITFLEAALQASLPEPYYAASGERVWIEVSRRFIEPDVNILRPSGGPARQLGGVALAESVHTRPIVVRVPHDERRQAFVEIFTRRDNQERLVTHIEVLSLTNKTPGEHGRDLYLRKQAEVLNSKTHLVEIDLLRAGLHTTAVPMDLAIEKAGQFDYHVCIHCFNSLEDYLLYPIRLEERLPVVAVPLLPGDEPVSIDLQAVFERSYNTGPYHRRVRYEVGTPVPPLRPEQLEWFRQLLGKTRPSTE